MAIPKTRLTKIAVVVAITLALVLTTKLYLSPDFMLQLGDMVWSCVG